MTTRDRLAGLLAVVIAFGVWCCILGFGAVANGTHPVVWWSILILLVIAPSICLGFVTWRWPRPPKI